MGVEPRRARLRRRLALVVPVLAIVYGTAWAVQGHAPFFTPAVACPEAGPSGSTASSPSSPAPSPSGPQASGGDERLSLSFGFQPDPLQPHAAVQWTFAVTNVSESVVSLTFATGQDGDVALSQNGQEHYRWSSGRAFTQSLRNVDLAPGEAHRFTLEDTLSVEPGSYDLVATVSSDPAPAPATRTVTVGDPQQTASDSPSAEASPDASTMPSPTGSPTATDTPSETSSPSPTDSPTASDSPSSPSATAGPVLLIPPSLWMLARRVRRRDGRRRRVAAIALVLALSTLSLGDASAQETSPTPDFEGSGGKNVVIVLNVTDGRLASRAGLLTGHASGPSVVPENIASATSSCTDCRTAAVALQAVVVISDPNVASPRNAASAVNAGCLRCATFAYAWQYVVSTGGPVRITPEGHQIISDLRAEASSLAASDLPFPTLEARLDAVAARFRAVIDNEVERVGGGQGISERAVDVEPAGC
jgi:hypothetical protein